MNILLNFIPLKQGGGVQVGLDFLNQAKLFGTEHQWYVVATEGTPFVNYNYSSNLHLSKVIPNNLWSRLFFEYIECKFLIKKTKTSVIYTQFGPIWPGSTKPNIAGCAYSNLMYPEINFWGKLSFFNQIKRKIIDYFRVRRMLDADYIIYETQDLAKRAIDIYNISKNRVHFVRPSVSSLINPHNKDLELKLPYIPNGFRILLLSHYREHKNFEILPLVSKILKTQYQVNNVIFILTLNNDKNLANILNLAKKLKVTDNIVNIGSVDYDSCSGVYQACNAVILPSLLESFSNSIAEAWVMKKPLLISDLDWAHSICQDAAIYIKHDNEDDIALQIYNLINNKYDTNNLIHNGLQELHKYSNSKSRFLSYKNIIESVT